MSSKRLFRMSLPALTAVHLLIAACSDECPTRAIEGPPCPAAGWVVQTPPTTTNIFVVDAIDASTVVAVGESGLILRTTDGGDNWSIIDSGTTERISSVHFADDDNGWAVGLNGLILKSTDAGRTWSQQTPNVVSHFRDVFFVDENTGWVVGSPWGDPDSRGYVIKTTDGGETWATRLDGNSNVVCFADADSGCVGWADGVQRTTDGGDNWDLVTLNLPGPLTLITFVDTRTGWAGGRFGFLARTDDGGATWTEQPDGTDRHINGMAFVSAARGWYSTSFPGSIASTIDGGATWVFQESPVTEASADMDFVDDKTGWIVGYNGLILKTVTGGE